MQRRLILGSSSPFRKELLQRLHLPFETCSPDIDESRLADETAEAYVKRLSLKKAKAIAEQFDDALVIGSDQCSVLEGNIRGKPYTHENAIKQLQESAGNTVSFLTGLCLYDTKSKDYQLDLIPFHVEFRSLSTHEIEAYLQAEQPYNCAGSFKSEGLGITLFKSMQGNDPTALIGLPLIRLSEMLRSTGINLPG
jgi:septum formation protein